MKQYVAAFACLIASLSQHVAQAETSLSYTVDALSNRTGRLRAGSAMHDYLQASHTGRSAFGEYSISVGYSNGEAFSPVFSGDPQGVQQRRVRGLDSSL